ncbi:MAG: Stk1 family PASTA domain-containing Ser/Thr kinase [Bulleidia sp.]
MSSNNMIAGRYEVVSHIGQGGMADVFLAVDTILNRQVAIKILRADLSGDTVSILRFEREAQAAASLAHPNIVEIYDVGDYKDHHYIVMEYVPGKTLKQVIRSRGPLVNEEAVDIMKQLCSAVAEAHSRGIIHRDIKPQNVIIKADGSLKILDFGIATALGSVQLTQANNVMGSVHYLAPELAKGEPASFQSDIYALGIVLYEMLSGDVPFKADQAVQVALKHMREPMPSVREINSTVPQSLENIITKATVKDPSLRYRNAEEMLADVSTCLRGERQNERKLVIRETPVKKTDIPKNLKQAETQIRRSETPQRDARKEMEKEASRTRTLKFLILILCLLIVFGVGSAMIFTGVISFGSTVQVPQITGMSLSDASAALEEKGLSIDEQKIRYELTTDQPAGTIISVTPQEGTDIEKDSAVEIVVSSGIGVAAKDYTGRNINEVCDEIMKEYPNMKINIQEESSPITSGTILSQTQLTPDTLFDPNRVTSITFTYSAYPTVTIPEDIIGKSISDAVSELEGMGLKVYTSNRSLPKDIDEMTPDEQAGISFGVVIDCMPASGTSYTQSTDNYITLYYY